MAFVQANLSLVSYSGNGFHIWHYTTTDASTVVDGAGYFNSMANEMNLGDVIYANTATGGTPVVSHTYFTENDGTNIDCVNGVAITNTDGD